MPSVFSRATTVLDYRPRRGRFGGGAGLPTVWLLWPAFACQLLMREEAPRTLDVFEEHVLRLCQAGVRDLGAIGRLLMAPDPKAGDAGAVSLAGRVVARLQRAGLLDEHLAPTPQAEAAATDRRAPRFAGWRLFQDAWTGTVWDRFGDPETGLAEIVRDRLGPTERTMTLRRDTGRPAEDQGAARPLGGVIVIDPGGGRPPATPKAEEITSRYAAWVADRARAERGRERPEETQADPLDDDEERQPTSLASVDDIGDPEPVLLLTCAFAVPREAGEGPRWEVADPFGMGISRRLRERLLMLLGEPGRDTLNAAIARLEQAGQGRPPQGELHEAEAQVDAAAGNAVRRHPQLRDELVTMQYSALRVAALAGRNKLREARGDVRNAIGTAQVALEWVCKLLAEQFNPRDAYLSFALVQGERAQNAAELSRVAKSLGFTGAAETGEFPGRLLYVDLRKIVSACNHREGSLNALLWAALLAAARELRDDGGSTLLADMTAQIHPLRQAARSYPALVMDVSDIAEARDNVNHAVIRPERHLDLLQHAVAVVYRVVNALLLPAPSHATLPAAPPPAAAHPGPAADDGA